MIESLTNSKIKYATKLKQKKYRNISGEFLIEGYHLVEEALKQNAVVTIFSTDDFEYDNIEFFKITNDVMRKLSMLNESNGIIAICRKSATSKLSEKILILDQVQDPGNMGTLIRTAAAFGFKTIISENSVDYYNDKVIRSSQGGIFYVNLREENILEFMEKNNDIIYIGTDVSKGKDIRNIDTEMKKTALILGNEGSGISAEILNKTNYNVKIPMLSTESLNVGIAGGILMYEIFRSDNYEL